MNSQRNVGPGLMREGEAFRKLSGACTEIRARPGT